MGYAWETFYYFQSHRGTSGFYLNREGSGSIANNQNISIYRPTGTGVNNDHRFKLTKAFQYSTGNTVAGCTIRSALNSNYGLNIYGYGSSMTAEGNCDLYPVGGDRPNASNYADSLIDLLTVDASQNLYRIALIKHKGLYLTPVGNYNNANVRWMAATGGDEQIWKLCTEESSGSSSNNRLNNPVPYTYISTYFSPGGHSGVDLVCPCGTPVCAPADGKIVFVKSWSSSNGTESWESMGNVIYMLHKGSPNLLTVYMHLREINSNLAWVGREVSAGELFAYSGNTGKVGGATGCHLHFTVIENNGNFSENNINAYHEGTKVNPLNYLP